MIDWALSFIAPHHCYGCGILGTLLCDNCKYNITDEPFRSCIACETPTPTASNVCSGCTRYYNRAWCVGERSDTLQLLIDNFKFSRAKSAYKPLAELLDATLPQLPSNTIIVPVPTVRSHVRERGYDHMHLIASQFAKRRGLELGLYLERATSTTQRGAGRGRRAKQAKAAFRCRTTLDVDIPYLILDDVVTTGATLSYAAKALRACGASQVWVASVSRQPI